MACHRFVWFTHTTLAFDQTKLEQAPALHTTHTMLTLTNISVRYGPITAVDNASLSVGDGEIVALLGANGAGKTSLLRAVSGLVPLSAGIVELGSTNISQLKPHDIVAAGLSHCPEGRHVFPDMTVLENLTVGAYLQHDATVIQNNITRAFHYFPTLAERRQQKAGTLSGGEQQMLAVGRCLMSSPKLLMLDEPSLGLAPMLIDQIFEIIRQINRQDGVSVLLVEQNAHEALLHADRGYVLESGRITLTGTAEELRHNPKVIDAYLGR